MAIELLEMSTEEFLQFINKYPELGDITVLDLTEAADTFSDLQPDDIVIYHDYCTDDIRRSVQEDVFYDWLMRIFDTIDEFMADRGYTIKADEQDGSGGGLWYGAVVYRKP